MIKRKIINYFVVVFGVIALDQMSKNWVLNHLQVGERVTVIERFWDWTLLFNSGAAFSFLASAGGWQKYFFLSLALVICGYLSYAFFKNHFGRIGDLGTLMVIGGAVGNVIDRLMHGHVVDFILLYFNNYYYPAFNIADSFICVGAVFLVIDGLRKPSKQPAETA